MACEREKKEEILKIKCMFSIRYLWFIRRSATVGPQLYDDVGEDVMFLFTCMLSSPTP